MTKPFQNPYQGIRVAYEKGIGSKPGRVTADISAEDFQFLFGLRIGEGTQQTTVNLLLNRLIYELKIRGITSVKQSDLFEHFVANCRFVLAGETLNVGTDSLPGGTDKGIGGDATSGPIHHDRRRTKGVRAKAEPAKK